MELKIKIEEPIGKCFYDIIELDNRAVIIFRTIIGYEIKYFGKDDISIDCITNYEIIKKRKLKKRIKEPFIRFDNLEDAEIEFKLLTGKP